MRVDEHLDMLNSMENSGSGAESRRTHGCESGSLGEENKGEDEMLCQTEDSVQPEDANSLPELIHDKDLVKIHPTLRLDFELTETVSISEEINVSKSAVHGENGCTALKEESLDRSLKIEGSSLSGAKRARFAIDEKQPSVHITYNSLTRASRLRLHELLHQWSEWHAKNVSSSIDPSEVVECGEETFFPALHVGQEKTSAVSFLMDNLTRQDKNKDFIPLDGNSVPLYDRGYAWGLTSTDGSSNVDSGLEIIDDAARCFNCGSYNHSLRECPRPRDNVAVNIARRQHKSKRNQNAASRNPTRYYQNSPAGKYDGLRPGVLDATTHQLLGLGEFDPPPWLNRMREIGYPPGYLDVDDEDQPSGITIYTDKDIAEQEDGEIIESDHSKQKRKMTVEFPGVNAPIPENADERLWAVGAGPSGSDISNNSRDRPHFRSNYSANSVSRGYFREERMSRDFSDDGPPGDPGYSSSRYSFQPRYGNLGFDRSPHHSKENNSARSPTARSQSDWSRRNSFQDEGSLNPSTFTSFHYSTPDRLLSPNEREPSRSGNWTSESLYDRDLDRTSRMKNRSEDRHYRSWR